MPHCISKRIRDRYNPPLPWDGNTETYTHGGPAPNVLSWLLIYDWTITDSERRAMTKALAKDTMNAPLDNASYLATNTVAVKFGLTDIRPCADCGKMTRVCPECGECPECAGNTVAECGHCSDCVAECESCAKCTREHRLSRFDCECAHCDHCSKACDTVCSCCNNCDRHCNCFHCGHCGETWISDDAPTCREGECDRCSSCCTCNRGAESNSIHGHGRYPVKSPLDRKVFRCSRLAGAEVEYVKCDDFEPIKAWCRAYGASVHSDGSVGDGDDEGWEAVTSPAAGDHIAAQVTALCRAFKSAGAEHDETCGVHVHVDASDFGWHDMARLLRLWAKIEPAMFILAGQRRLVPSPCGTHYCMPWANGFAGLNGDTGKRDPKGSILRTLYRSYDEAAAKEHHKGRWENGIGGPDKKAGYRYHALNIAPWIARLRAGAYKSYTARKATKLGTEGYYRKEKVSDATVEFRLHEDTLQRDELVNWMHLCVRIVEWVSGCSDKDVDALPKSQIRALMIIAPECKDYLLRKVKAFRQATGVLYGGGISERAIGYRPGTGYTIGLSSPIVLDYQLPLAEGF